MAPLDVTVAVVPRERFSLTERALENLYAQTTTPFTLVYVSAGAPSAVQQYLEQASKQRGFQLMTAEGYVSPNQARNMAMRGVSTKYVVFLDNDALVTPHWLERLVQCAEDTNASVVGPLYLIGEIEEQLIHMAGGTLHFKDRDGRRIAYDEHRLVDTTVSQLTEPLRRAPCDFVEFHCMLLRTDLFNRVGPLDEQLLSLHEHVDVGWAAREAGGSVYVEPAAVTSYLPPPPLAWSDLPYFMLRWSDDWATGTIQHFNQKWGVAATRHFGDEDFSVDLEDTAIRFARGHRRLATGLRIPGDWAEGAASTTEQARLAIALLMSVDRDRFDLVLTTMEDEEVETESDIAPEPALNRLPAILDRAERDRLNVLVRPRPARRANEPALVTVEVDGDTLAQVEPYGFMTLKTGLDLYQVWLAIDVSNWRSASIVRRLASGAAGQTALRRLAGSLILDPDDSDRPAGDCCRVVLHSGIAGALTSGMDLERGGVLAHLWSCEVY